MRSVCIITILLAAVPLQAAYTLTPLSADQHVLQANWGDTFQLDFVLTSSGADVHNSAIFQVLFTQPGLLYQGYDWAAPYGDTPPYDDSTPGLGALPLALAADTLTGPGHPAGVVDVELSNLLVGQEFSAGTLVTMTLTVPQTFGLTGALYIVAQPDTFARGFDLVPTTAGPVFELWVTPEPAGGLALLILAGLARRARRA